MTDSKKWALITGGTSGLGFASAQALAKDYHLALNYAGNEEKAKVAQELLSKEFSETKVLLLKKPLQGHTSAKELFDQFHEESESYPSVLINAAGKLRDGLFLGSEFSLHEEMVQEHLMSVMALCHLSLKNMYRDKFGRIINFSSVSAQYYKKGQVNYATVKSAIEGFTKCLAMEVAHRGITINALAPGLIETPMTEEMIQKLKEEKMLRKKIPAARAGRPEEVGALVKHLCSEEAAYITGSVLTIDGGRSLGDASV